MLEMYAALLRGDAQTALKEFRKLQAADPVMKVQACQVALGFSLDHAVRALASSWDEQNSTGLGTLLNLSVHHLEPKTLEFIDEVVSATKVDYGCYVLVPQGDQYDTCRKIWPKDLLHVFEHARERKCVMIRFDEDTPPVAGLPTYNRVFEVENLFQMMAVPEDAYVKTPSDVVGTS